jgi:alanine racemase
VSTRVGHRGVSRGSWIEIDRERLLSNIAAFRSVTDPGCALMVVVKANAYGHGAAEVAPLVATKADWLGVNSLEEAQELAGLGIEKPIAILGYTPPDRSAELVRQDFRQVIFRLDAAESLSRAARKLKKEARVHMKVETGTNRLGIPIGELEGFLREIRRLPALDVEGIYTHFANIEDTLDPSFAQLQLARFREALAIVERAGVTPRFVHAAATAGVLLYPDTHFSMVRVGIGAYGIWPSRETRLAARERGKEIRLQPVLSWKARIAQVKEVAAGEFIGYGLTYEARRPMQVAVVPIGYYEGIDRKLSNSGRALVRGQPASLVGRVAMNMVVLDVTATGAAADEEVVLIGRQGSAEIRVEELAEKSGTIPYETLARIHPSLPRRVVGSSTG